MASAETAAGTQSPGAVAPKAADATGESPSTGEPSALVGPIGPAGPPRPYTIGSDGALRVDPGRTECERLLRKVLDEKRFQLLLKGVQVRAWALHAPQRAAVR